MLSNVCAPAAISGVRRLFPTTSPWHFHTRPITGNKSVVLGPLSDGPTDPSHSRLIQTANVFPPKDQTRGRLLLPPTFNLLQIENNKKKKKTGSGVVSEPFGHQQGCTPYKSTSTGSDAQSYFEQSVRIPILSCNSTLLML